MKRPKISLSLRKQPTQERAKEKVDLIFQATTQLLEKDGFEKTSTNKIAEKAGISIGSLYQYFPTKDAILSAMMKAYVERHTAMIQKKMEARKNESLREVIRGLVSIIIEDKKKEVRFNKMFAQKMFGYNFMDLMQQQDATLIELSKLHLKPFENEIRDENIELALYMVIQTMKIVPAALIFQTRFKLDDPKVVDELSLMFYQYLKKI